MQESSSRDTALRLPPSFRCGPANQVIGAAGFDKFRAAREWPSKLLEQLSLAVSLFGSAIERKQSEIALQAARSEIRIASRRNMMSELVASLVHEINQPLGAMLSNLGGVTRLLSQKNPEPITALAAVGDAIEDTKRTAEIVRRVRFLFKGHAEQAKSRSASASWSMKW